MSYYFSKLLPLGFDAALAVVTAKLKDEGFGIITEIDVTNTLKNKIGVEFRPYRILGACNPTLAHEALKLEDKVGTMLPCNVIVQELAPGRVEVAAIDPVYGRHRKSSPPGECTDRARQAAKGNPVAVRVLKMARVRPIIGALVSLTFASVQRPQMSPMPRPPCKIGGTIGGSNIQAHLDTDRRVQALDQGGSRGC